MSRTGNTGRDLFSTGMSLSFDSVSVALSSSNQVECILVNFDADHAGKIHLCYEALMFEVFCILHATRELGSKRRFRDASSATGPRYAPACRFHLILNPEQPHHPSGGLGCRVDAQNLDHFGYICQLQQGCSGQLVLTAQKIGEKDILPGVSTHGTRFYLA